MLEALRTHAQDPEVQREGLRSLADLAADHDNKSTIAGAGGVVVVRRVLLRVWLSVRLWVVVVCACICAPLRACTDPHRLVCVCGVSRLVHSCIAVCKPAHNRVW